MTDLLQMMIDIGHPVYPVFTNRKWIEIDSMRDYELAQKMVVPANGRLRIIDAGVRI
jgi:NDP-sugar pyrophosphorylase family protein